LLLNHLSNQSSQFSPVSNTFTSNLKPLPGTRKFQLLVHNSVIIC
jgi:hypothetical protein